MAWPNIFPTDCPFAGAVEAKGDIFRLVDSDPAKEVDLMSNRQLNPKKSYMPDATVECMACGLSVFRAQDMIEASLARLRSTAPAKFGAKKIAKAVLTTSLGEIALTEGRQKGHHTWWLPDGVGPPFAMFKVI